ncbi:MAG: molecular chaperone DnaJ [Pseudomonadota bacterium]|nr:molecular chaperone DnaJ [Pseudomonadota bacterium]
MAQDFYEILGVKKDADPDAIKKAFRQMAMKYHPDRNPGDKSAEDKFKEAASAYEILSDKEKRTRYDRFGHAGVNGMGGRGHPGFHDVNDIFSSFSDIFSDFFGGGQRTERRDVRRRGADLRYLIDISLEDVVGGIEKDIEFECEASCAPCKGKGAAKGSEAEVCKQCGGAGQVVRNQGFFSMATTCPSCRGQGAVIKDPCAKCKGTGRELKKRNLKVTVPAGVDTGTRLRVVGEGEGGYSEGVSGDLYVEIRVKPHKIFERQGQNLGTSIHISYIQAILGGEVKVPIIKGEETLSVPTGTQPGEVLMLPGQGVPHLKGYGRGNILYEVVVDVPKKLDKEEDRLLREIAGLKGHSTPAKGFFRRK